MMSHQPLRAEDGNDMWMALLDIFRGGDSLKELADDFQKMLKTGHEMAQIVRPHVFDHSLTLAQRKKVYELDIKVNKLERRIRKRVVTHLTTNPTQVPYCLLLVMIVKDAERIGDYVKNVTEVSELGGGAVANNELAAELNDLIDIAMELFDATPAIIAEQNRELATELIQAGRGAAKRCDRLLVELAKSDLVPAQVTSLVLLTRFYKRIGAHLVNILSSVVMPVHKVDFFDERLFADHPDSGVDRSTTVD